MFAKSGRSTKRLIVGYLGVAMGSTLILLSANAGLAAAAPKLDKLEVEGLCTLPNDGFAVMLVSNSNSVEVDYKWDIDKTSSPPESAKAPPGDSYLLVPSSHNNVRIYVDDKQILAPKQDSDVCAFHVQPAKRWVDEEGHPLDSPDVPKSWKLTLESGDETVTCTWKKGALSCDSDALDVPFGFTYKVTESATPGFDQEGTGEFGPLQTPPNLTAFFNSDQNIGVTVTNQLAKEEVVIAATTTAATTTAATTTAATTTAATTTAATTTAATTTAATTTAATTTAATTTAATTTAATTTAATTTAATTTAATTTVGEETSASTTAEDEESTTTTATTIEALITGESVTTEPTTTEAATSTLAPATTLAPPTTLGSTTSLSANTTATPDETSSTVSEGSDGAPSSEALPTDDRAELTGDDADPAAVDPSQDTLPLTGGEAGLVAGLGFALVVAGLGLLGFVWGSATPGRHARRRRMTW